MIKVGIIGGAGFVAGELIRCLIHHPKVEIAFIQSKSQAGKSIGDIHQDLFWNKKLVFTNKMEGNVDLIFMCLGHGKSKSFLEENPIADSIKIIDLSNDFRLAKDSRFQNKNFIYGLVASQSSSIKEANYIANPGCFATAIQLSLLPLVKSKHALNDVHIHAITGSTGAGQSLQSTTHFSWRSNNISVYKSFQHQHLDEIKATVLKYQPEFKEEIHFVPMRGDFTRGIFCSMYTKTEQPLSFWISQFEKIYNADPFIHLTDKEIHLKQVINTNHCIIHLTKHGNQLHITTAIDNLLKGAAGQAIENMNLMLGYEVETGLNLKATIF